MGRPKATLPFGGETMLGRTLRLAGQAAQPLVVVAAEGQELPKLPAEITVARDRRPDRGPLEGLAAGLAAIAGRADAAYVTSCDCPLLRPAFVARMFQLLGDHDIAVPTDGRYDHPLSAVYRTSVLPEIEKFLRADRLRPVFLFDRVKTLRVHVDDLRDVDPELDSLENLNHPQDYVGALGKAGLELDQATAAQLGLGSQQ